MYLHLQNFCKYHGMTVQKSINHINPSLSVIKLKRVGIKCDSYFCPEEMKKSTQWPTPPFPCRQSQSSLLLQPYFPSSCDKCVVFWVCGMCHRNKTSIGTNLRLPVINNNKFVMPYEFRCVHSAHSPLETFLIDGMTRNVDLYTKVNHKYNNKVLWELEKKLISVDIFFFIFRSPQRPQLLIYLMSNPSATFLII